MTTIERLKDRRIEKISVWARWVACLAVVLGCISISAHDAAAETRTLKLYFIHTKEKAEITFKRNGRYDQAGLRKINQFLRDWRQNEPTKMNPRLLDLVWETYQAVGGRDYIHVVSAYRSPKTNSMLRRRSNGVAEKSQHMLGNAMDFFIPGVPLAKLRAAGLKMQSGGVGYYPRSGSPFVHFDVGRVRHWPRMSRKELVAVFPNGKTLHVPSDGKPLPGYDQAVASYEARKKKGTTALALASTGSSSTKSGGLLATLFGGGADDEEDTAEQTAPRKPKSEAKRAPAAPPVQKPVETVRKQAEPSRPGIMIVPPDEAQPIDIAPQQAEEPAAPARQDTPEAIIAALPSRSIPLPVFAPRPKAEVTEVAALETTTESRDLAAVVPPPNTLAAAKLAADQAAEAASLGHADDAIGAPPIPGWRPDYVLPPAVEAADTDDATLLALAASDTSAVPLPAARPADADEQADGPTAAITNLFGAVPEPRPDLPIPSPEQAMSGKSKGDRVTIMASADTPKTALARKEKGRDPVAALNGSVRTTKKAQRPTATDSQPSRRAVVVPSEPDDARWALRGELVTLQDSRTTAPSMAYNIVRTAPVEVYTAGFQQSLGQAQPNRFTGKAVSFLSVARFAE